MSLLVSCAVILTKHHKICILHFYYMSGKTAAIIIFNGHDWTDIGEHMNWRLSAVNNDNMTYQHNH